MPIRIVLISLITVFGALTGLAQGRIMACTNSPRSHWMSWQEIEARLHDQGQRLVRLRIAGDRCLAVLTLDGKGEYREMQMDPVSGKVLQSQMAPEPRQIGSLPWRVPRY